MPGKDNVVSIDDNAGSLTVDAPTGTPVNVQIGDGTDQALVTTAGELNVIDSSVFVDDAPFALTTSSASGVVGPFAPSAITFTRSLIFKMLSPLT